MRAKRRMPALLATGVIAALGLTGALAATAMAEAPGEHCITEFEPGTSAAYKGEGSSLQKIAQELWTGVKGSAGFNVNKMACNGSGITGVRATNKTKVSYTSDGSAAGLEAFGVGKHKTPAESKDIFIGTDDAPNATQMKEIDEEAGNTSGKGQALVVPVAQAAVAIVMNPPTGCALKSHHITNADLQKIWAREITKWSEISTKEGTTACEVEIKRVVREDGSGTTYQFKHYLFEINKTNRKATKAGEPERTWEELQPETTRNLEWPEEEGAGKPVRGKGNGGVVLKVWETEDSIGYANLSDARAGLGHSNFTWAAVENGKAGKFEFPGVSTGEPSATGSEANCEGTSYTGLPSVGPDDDWSSVYGGHPKTNEHYSVCTLTWDVALVNYELAGYPTPTHDYGEAAYDYLNYVVAPLGGQTDFASNDYQEVQKAVRTFAVEEALLIAGGVDLMPPELLLTFTADNEKKDIVYTNKGPTSFTPGASAISTGSGGSGGYADTENKCSTILVAVSGTCLILVELIKLPKQLEFLWLIGGPIIHLD